MSLLQKILRINKNYPNDKSQNIESDLYFVMNSLNIFINKEIEVIIKKKEDKLILSDKQYFITDLSFQVICFIKNNLLSRVIEHEFIISKEESILNGTDEESLFHDFVKNLSNESEWIEYLFEKYPLLHSRLETYCNNILGFLQNVLLHYVSDYESIIKLGVTSDDKLLKLSLFAGDLHNNGKHVCFFEFESGYKIVYKPRNANNEKAFCDIMENLNRLGFHYRIGLPQFICKGNHSWLQFITSCEVKSENDLYLYYKNVGSILCFFYIIGTNDIIPDNVISREGIFHIIDIEALMSRPKNFLINVGINDYFESSVVKTGILPQWMYNGDGERNVLSSVLFCFNNNSEVHLPILQEKPIEIKPKYLKDFIEGFITAYKFFHNNKEVIKKEILNLPSLKEIQNRMILHPTTLYVSLLDELKIPEYMQGKEDISNLIKNIIKLEYIDDTENYFHNSIKKQLLRGDVPIFYADKKHSYLIDGDGIPVLEDFNWSNRDAVERIRLRLDNLSSSDLNFQVGIIENSIQCIFESTGIGFSSVKFISHNNKMGFYDYIKIAKIIGDELYEKKTSVNGEINWISKNRNSLDGRYETMPMNQDLYDGAVGIALFFIYLSKYTKDDKYIKDSIILFEHYKKIFQDLVEIRYFTDLSLQRKEYHPLSVFGYPLSLLYLMVHLPKKYHDKQLVHQILMQLKAIMPFTKQFDLFLGLIGLLDYIIENNSLIDKVLYDDLLNEIIDILYSKSVSIGNGIMYPYFDPFDKFRIMYLGGYAHGSAGIAYILNKVRKEFPDKEELLSPMIGKLLIHDRSFFDESIQGWIDGRSVNEKYDGGSWCHGSAGIALSRLLLSQSGINDDLLLKEIDIAYKSILRNGIGGNQSVCHGDMGNLEVLYAIGKFSDNYALTSLVEDKLSIIGNQLMKGYISKGGDDGYVGLYNLFLGKAGVGYQFLRFAKWEECPSILCPEYPNNLNKILH